MSKMNFFSPVAVPVVIMLTTFSSVCFAETKVITTDASYTMGDGESPSFAEAQALQKAKQAALEQAGTYVETYTKVKNYDLTTDEIQTLAGGILTVEVLEKSRKLLGDGLRFYTKIRATVTTDKMEELAQRIKGKNMAHEYKNLQGEYTRLSGELETWKKVAAEAKADAKRQTALDRIKQSEKDFARAQETEAALLRRLDANRVLFDRLEKMDREGVVQALKDGANPNAVDRDAVDVAHPRKITALETLILSAEGLKFSAEMSGSKNVKIENAKIEDTTIEIANVLFDHGAKVSKIYDYWILTYPVWRGWAKLTELLIQHGADPRTKMQSETPMELAISSNQPKVVEVLVAHGVPRLDEGKASTQRFIGAVGRYDSGEIARLSEGRIDVNAKNDQGETALIVALRMPVCTWEHSNIITFLLVGLGADPNLTGEKGWHDIEGIPLHLAVASSKFALGSARGDCKKLAPLVIENLLKYGGKVAQRDSKGRTALHIAAKDDNVVAAKILLVYGMTVMPRDNSGRTPLDYAESATMIKFLKSHGATELNH